MTNTSSLAVAHSSSVVRLFAELAVIPSPPGEERGVADRVIEFVEELGLEIEEDAVASRIGGTTGNLLVRLPTHSRDTGHPLFLCAHLDTVPPEGRIEPIVTDGTIRNACDTILGADNKASVAAILEALHRIVVEERSHSGIELVFTPMEETGCRGAKEFDETRLSAKFGYVYDHAAPVGTFVEAAPFGFRLETDFHGCAAHAGIAPEEGRSSIEAAARAIGRLSLGRLDDETTANVGTIHGGAAHNIVPDHCSITADIRSRSKSKAARLVRETVEVCSEAAAEGGCRAETRVEEKYLGYRLDANDMAVMTCRRAFDALGIPARAVGAGGGADANVFNARGLSCLNLANGMARIHSSDEHIRVADLERMVDVTLALVDAARSGGT